MEKGYRFRIYPNKKQQVILAKTFGCKRYVYNYFLERKITLYKEEGKSLSFNACSKELTALRKEFDWLSEIDRSALQNTLKDLDTAFNRFYKEKGGFPKFKKKKTNYRSYRTSKFYNNIKFLGKKIKLPKLGLVNCKGYKNIDGRILNVTISQVPSGKYYASICVTDVEPFTFEKSGEKIGIDMGIKDFCITSNGIKYENPKYLEQSLEKLAKLQRELSRKTKGSSNWEKARVKLAKLYEHIANQRADYLHKLSHKLIKENDVICCENLKVKNMTQNHNLARSISDASWTQFTNQLEYKACWYDKKIIKIDTFFASSQLCSKCGYKHEDVKNLAVREWVCPSCNAKHNRDINAALNILNEGVKQMA